MAKTFNKKIRAIFLGSVFVFSFFFFAGHVSAAVLDPSKPVTTCGEMAVGVTYTIGANINVGSSTPCFIISASGVTIDDSGNHTITANFAINNDGSITFGNWGGNDTSWPGTRTWTFNGNSYNAGTVTGLATFNGNSYNRITVNGNAIFNDTSYGYFSDVYGNAVFNNNSYNGNTIHGNATFNGNSYNSNIVNGTATFNGNSYNGNIVNGDMILNDYVAISGVATISSSTFRGVGTVSGSIRDSVGNIITGWNFINGAILNGTITGSTTFNDTSRNEGNVIGEASFYGSSVNRVTVTGNANFYDNSDSFYAVVTGSQIFNGNSTNDSIIYGNPVFNDDSTNDSIIYGNAVFNGNSYNSSAINGNADVYYSTTTSNIDYPVRPLGGSVSGVINYHNYPGLYFNDSVSNCDSLSVCGAGDGDWGNIKNWWTNDTFTIHAPILPQQGDKTYVYSDVRVNSGSPASVNMVTFNNGVKDRINMVVSSGAVFTSTSTAMGTTTGTTTFNGDNSIDSGVTIGSVVRQYTSNATTTRNFTTDGGRSDWIITAYNSTVNLVGATYSLVSNIFKAFANSIFITMGAPVTPIVTINSTVSSDNSKWQPSVSWGNSTLCQYQWNSSADSGYTTVDCSKAGSDIPRPTPNSSQTLWVRGSVSSGDLSERSASFYYDTTKPYAIGADCSVENLDESSRPYYYLTGNTTGTCTFKTSATLIGGEGFSLNGNIVADGFNLSLENIVVTGTTTSNGVGSGGNGGTIIVATSTTSSILANGASGSANGGNGGTITIINSISTFSDAVILANGGNSTSCGNGGDAGNITLINSSYSNINATAGNWSNIGCLGSSSYTSGNSYTPTVIGSYVPPASSNPVNTILSTTGGWSAPISGNWAATPNTNNYLSILNPIKPLVLPSIPRVLPNVGTNPGVTKINNPLEGLLAPGNLKFGPSVPIFFGLPINNFVFSSLQDPIYTVYNSNTLINPSFFIRNNKIIETIVVDGGSLLQIYVPRLGNHPVATMTATSTPGIYSFTNPASSIQLNIHVITPAKQPVESPPSLWSRFKAMLKYIIKPLTLTN